MNTDYFGIAQRVLAALATYGIKAVCIGGGPRDLLHGRTPKDLDFIVFGSPSIRDAEDAMGFQLGSNTESFSEYLGADLHERLGWVVKANIEGVPVDIICPTEPVSNAIEASETLDVNLNQVWFEPTENNPRAIRTIDDYPETDSCAYPVKLISFDDVTLERIEYLRDKFPQYIFSIDPKDLHYPQPKDQ